MFDFANIFNGADAPDFVKNILNNQKSTEQMTSEKIQDSPNGRIKQSVSISESLNAFGGNSPFGSIKKGLDDFSSAILRIFSGHQIIFSAIDPTESSGYKMLSIQQNIFELISSAKPKSLFLILCTGRKYDDTSKVFGRLVKKVAPSASIIMCNRSKISNDIWDKYGNLITINDPSSDLLTIDESIYLINEILNEDNNNSSTKIGYWSYHCFDYMNEIKKILGQQVFIESCNSFPIMMKDDMYFQNKINSIARDNLRVYKCSEQICQNYASYSDKHIMIIEQQLDGFVKQIAEHDIDFKTDTDVFIFITYILYLLQSECISTKEKSVNYYKIIDLESCHPQWYNLDSCLSEMHFN